MLSGQEKVVIQNHKCKWTNSRCLYTHICFTYCLRVTKYIAEMFDAYDGVVTSSQWIKSCAQTDCRCPGIVKTRCKEHTTPVFRSFLWHPVRCAIKCDVFINAHQSLNGLGPKYIADMLIVDVCLLPSAVLQVEICQVRPLQVPLLSTDRKL